MRIFLKILSSIAIAAAPVTVAPMTASAAQLECTETSFSSAVATVTGVQTTSSTTAVNLTGATIERQISGGCAIVDFSAQFRSKSPKVARISVTADNGVVVTKAFPASADFSTSVNGYDGRAMTFVFPNLPGCLCTFQIQFLSVDGTPISVSKGVMKLLFTEQ